MAYIKDTNGKAIDFDAVVILMDDDIREDLASNYEAGFDTPQAFADEYARRHAEKFDGEEFAPMVGGAW